jgi:hypothetical protein
MARVKMPHLMHERHLCFLENVGFIESFLEGYKALVRNPKFICKKCGRSVAKSKNLYQPEKL